MWIFHALSGRFPFITGSIDKDRICLRRFKTGDVFDEPSLIAIEHKNGRKHVAAIGRSAGGLYGAPGFSVLNPVESLEPLFADFDVAVAIVQHAIREIFHARTLLAPKVVLQLEGRQSPLSEDEKSMLQRFAKSCGIARLYLYLANQPVPDGDDRGHSRLVRTAHFTTRFVA